MFSLLARTAHFIVIDKAPGVGFHREDDAPALIDVVREALAEPALWPVHRLDKPTSGLMLFARSEAAARALSDALAGHRLRKFYLALSDRAPAKKQGWVKGDMVKARGGAWRLAHSADKPAVTRFLSFSLAPRRRLFLLAPFTGRTHQLRVAMKSVSAPILGDALYGGTAADRVYLHAYALSFDLFGEAYRYVCPPSVGAEFLTPECAASLAELGQPWALL
ncbi:TIGR01621 family pseudouridine synthase [Crenobacter luteus]|uniref:RNA pseudouridine synthase n=1 Tax=Crenobacter luteus TaxID=1452487 RepID=A0A161SFY6_9NEIS|nr:TIGR01621 family pseudouridine synthase [Crenobacter luteus]KZE31810.1 RNA pseudouridine synthase [Crenobacter luteus]